MMDFESSKLMLIAGFDDMSKNMRKRLGIGNL
jgi:hypothetical protein